MATTSRKLPRALATTTPCSCTGWGQRGPARGALFWACPRGRARRGHGVGDLGLHLRLGDVGVGPGREGGGDLRLAVRGRIRREIQQPVDAIELLLDHL